MNTQGKVLAVCISKKKGTAKHQVDAVEMRVDWGIVGDAHAANWHRQVSLLGQESADKVIAQGLKIKPGAFAENILTEGLVLYTLPIGTQMRLGTSLVEVTQIGKECHQGCAIRELTGDCVMPREGIFVKVLEDGMVKPGDAIQILEPQA